MAAIITHYAIVKAESATELVDTVVDRLGEGWQPLGGANFAVNEAGVPIFMQTLIRTRRTVSDESPRRVKG